ncbi:MAG TPA: S8 family peptidase [Acidobacteriota bacterium]|nr:S8 family peptidase [Acidobacteriota bacterium]
MSVQLNRRFMERLILGNWDVQRFTQDSPVLPDVWVRYGEEPDEPLDLILTPEREFDSGKVVQILRERCRRLRNLEAGGEEEGANAERPLKPRLAYTQGHIAARFYLEQMVRLILPTTEWWKDLLGEEGADWDWERIQDILAEGLPSVDNGGLGRQPPELSRELQQQVWTVRLLGTLECRRREREPGAGLEAKDGFYPPSLIIGDFRKLIGSVPPDVGPPLIHLVSRNRPSNLAVDRSCLAVKADAARRLFKVDCSKINWAVIDSGIDARHQAFLEDPSKAKDNDTSEEYLQWTRVKATYDFTRVRDLLDPDILESSNRPDYLTELLEEGEDELSEQLGELKRRLLFGRPVDWSLLEDFLRVPHIQGQYREPKSEHGTHVAGILGAAGKMEGVCPDIRLYDLRVVRPGGDNDEFSVLAALQFVQHLNERKDFFAIHGANISLSITHAVENYACGRTPVCNECANLVNSGVVVVAAAGNQGYLRYRTEEGESVSGYRTVSITDPGNAAAVITVGATHRSNPHSYGVSFFSSRGPTGDGRCKPDLVAPGEKINAPVPNGKACKDGTSMAAPHVSGAAAMLMARHREFVGRPAEIKDILCRTATDLGRERYFQGAGMLDVLRALQSI